MLQRFLLALQRFLLVPQRFLLAPQRFLLALQRFLLAPQRFLLAPQRFLLAQQTFLDLWSLRSHNPEGPLGSQLSPSCSMVLEPAAPEGSSPSGSKLGSSVLSPLGVTKAETLHR